MMRTAGFILGMALVLGLVAYVCWHLWRVTPLGWPLKVAVVGVFVLWMVCEFVGFAVMERLSLKAATVLYEVGNVWLIVCLYLLLLFVVADLASLCHLLPKAFLKDSGAGLAAVLGIVTVLLCIGGAHYPHKYREEMTIVTDKPLEKPMTVVLASDLHIGYHNRRAELSRWADLIDAENPDLVLFGGDIIDRSLRPVVAGHCAEEFQRIHAPLFTVLGNHEYYSGVEQAGQFFQDAGITLLKDSVAHFQGIDIIGRNDRAAGDRADLAPLAKELSGFTIVLDHQPYHLEEAELAGVDFQFSGHTHRGQVWPISWVTDALYEKAWGPHRRGATQYYISSGLGIWGPKIRLGSRSEYLVLHIVSRSSDSLK